MAGVVVDETLLEVLGDSGVVVLPGGDVAQDIDVVKAGGGHGGRFGLTRYLERLRDVVCSAGVVRRRARLR